MLIHKLQWRIGRWPIPSNDQHVCAGTSVSVVLGSSVIGCRAQCCFASAGGENVYCSEVEAVVSAHPQVLQAAAFGMPNSIMGEMVHSAVVLRHPSISVTPQDIITWCQSQLAPYKCPTTVHIVTEVPTTGSGKVLKNVLRATFSQRGASAAGHDTSTASLASANIVLADQAEAASPTSSSAEADCAVLLLEAALAQTNGIPVIDCAAEDCCLESSLCHILVADDLSQAAMAKVRILACMPEC